MATYDLTQPLTDLNGEPIKLNEKGETRSLGDMIVEALLTDLQGEDVDAKTKLRRYGIAQKIETADGPVELGPTTVTEIHQRCGKVLRTLAFGKIAEVLGTLED